VVSKAGKFGRDQLVEFRWELAVGDDALTEDEIAVLAETKAAPLSPPVHPRGPVPRRDDSLGDPSCRLVKGSPNYELGAREANTARS
jgi:hypothetical protein